MDFSEKVAAFTKKLEAAGYGYIPTRAELYPFRDIDLVKKADDLVTTRTSQPNDPRRYLFAALENELSRMSKTPNKQFVCDGEDLPIPPRK